MYVMNMFITQAHNSIKQVKTSVNIISAIYRLDYGAA